MRARVLAAAAGLTAAWLTVAPALAQTPAAKPAGEAPARPDEDAMFGAPAAPENEPPEAPATPEGAATKAGPEGEGAHAPPATDATRDDAVLGDPSAGTKFSSDVAPENPLTIGGQFYLRAQTSALESQKDKPQDWALSSPSLLDVYFDGRPNQRVRGFVLGRMQFDPTLPAEGSTANTVGSLEASGSTMGSAPLSSLLAPRTRGPNVALDQMWLRFDVKRTVFVTAGKQHVRWGTARFWTPTDFLHVRRRNPLDVFDARTGTTMLKLHVPWEEKGWNFYAYGVTEGPGATSTVGDVAGAARAEIVLGTNEAGIGAMVQRNRKPKLAADLSTGIGDVDLYGEVALRYGSEIDRVNAPATMPDLGVASGITTRDQLVALVDQYYPVYVSRGIKPQVTGGFSYSRKYADNDVFTLGGEYFYNALGYDSSAAYPGLVLPHSAELREPASFFYLGRHYGALFLLVPAPFSWDLTTFTLSTLGNLSDRSFISRLDYSLTLLTHLRFEAFAAVHYGRSDGEFRFGFFGRSPALVDLGVALRVSL